MTLPQDSVDSLVTDPPAGIAFMGKEWDKDKGGRDEWIAWMTGVMLQAKRVMKPGAHGFVWALPRTSHWTATALENAGFEVRDIVTHVFGSGFPKSLDVSKAIDKAAGAEREVVGVKENAEEIIRRAKAFNHGSANDGWARPWRDDEEKLKEKTYITAPATDSAKQWQGWGTALKPASEHWILIRKPISEKTVAANVIKWGTGAINVDASRIEYVGMDPRIGQDISYGLVGDAKTKFSQIKDKKICGTPAGRFPANFVLSEGEAVEELDRQSGVRPGDKPRKNSANADTPQIFTSTKPWETTGHTDSGGASRFFYIAKASKRERNEGCGKVKSWEGQDQSLAAPMEELSQLARDTSDDILRSLASISWNTVSFGSDLTDQSRQDMTFIMSTVTKLIIDLRTSNCFQRSITSASILDAIRTIEATGLNLAESAEIISRLKAATTDEKTVSALGAVVASSKMLQTISDSGRPGNIHSTVKPLALMKYLIKMITPPGGTVLDPFAGSGSTGVAAKSEGFEFIGIEREPEYAAIAEARLAL